jgi:quercetin dioxygenase-like cupin family protein
MTEWIAQICLNEITGILAAITAFFGIVVALGKVFCQLKSLKRELAMTRTDLLEGHGIAITKQYERKDKRTYVTLDYRMDGIAQCLRIPLSFDEITEPLDGMRLQLVEHSKKETVYSVSTIGHHALVRFHWHYHEEMEIVQVVKGKVTDVQTGRIYKPGEIWVIDPNVRHIADFDEAFCLCTVRPPLPYAETHPIMLFGVGSVYDAIEPLKP